jgi:hypothetical protein
VADPAHERGNSADASRKPQGKRTMTDIGTSMPTGYISDAELIAWLEQKSEEQYASLRDVMMTSEHRSDMMKDLSDLKSDIDAGKPPEELLIKIGELREKYKDSPYAAELDELLAPMEELYARSLTPEQRAELDEMLSGGMVGDLLGEETKAALSARLGDVEDDIATVNAAAHKKEFSSRIQSEIDQLGRTDQLELIKIQELMSDARQTSQLGSNIMSSRDQASNTIVGNIRG